MNERLDILLKQSEDLPHWMFCRLLAMMQWSVF